MEWETKKLAQVAQIIPGYAFKGKHFGSIGESVIKIKDISPPNINYENAQSVNFDLYDKGKLEKFRLLNGDSVIAMTGATIGKVGRHKSESKVYVNQRVARITPKLNIDPDYLYYLLSSNVFDRFIQNNIDSNSAQANISGGSIGRFSFLIPKSINDQTRIARTLSLLDAKIDLLRRQNATLEALGAAVFREWFVEEEWPMESIGDMLTIVGGGTPSTKQEEYWNGDIAWTTPKDLSSNQGVYLNNTIRTISDKGLSRVSSGLLPEGTLLMSSRAPVGYLAITGIPMAINQGYIAILKGSKLPLQFVYFWLKANMVYIKNSSNGSVFQEISKRVFRSLDIEVPSNEYLERFTKYAESLFQKIRVNQEQIDHIQSLRDLLLPKLMSGQVKVRDNE